MAHLLQVMRGFPFSGTGVHRRILRVTPDPSGALRFITRSIRALLLVLFCCRAPIGLAAETKPSTKPPPAKLQIAGYGFLGNRQLKRMLITLELAGKKPEFFSSSFVEDAALILASRVKRDGYLHPRIDIAIKLVDGAQIQTDGHNLIDNPLPRRLQVISVRFQIHKGVLYYFKSLQFEGLHVVSPKTARAYFFETEPLFSTKHARAYTPEGLRRGLSSLTDVLDREGYQEAKTEATDVQQDDSTGAVHVSIKVQEGRRFFIRSIREEFVGNSQSNQNRTVSPNCPYSRIWLQDFSLGIKTNEYHLGYPDTT